MIPNKTKLIYPKVIFTEGFIIFLIWVNKKIKISKKPVDIIRPDFVNQENKTLKAMMTKLINGIIKNIQKINGAENSNKE